MKRRPQDKVYVDGKYITKARIVVIEALQTQGREGATKVDILTLVGEEIGGERPQGAIGNVLTALIGEGEVVEVRNNRGLPERYYLKDCAPRGEDNGVAYRPPASVSPNGGNGKVAPMAAKRKGKTIAVYTSPRVFEDAIALSLFIGGRWFKIPLAGSARVCYGQETPMWSADQEMYSDVETIKVHLRNGQVHEEHPARSDVVTILLEE